MFSKRKKKELLTCKNVFPMFYSTASMREKAPSSAVWQPGQYYAKDEETKSLLRTPEDHWSPERDCHARKHKKPLDWLTEYQFPAFSSTTVQARKIIVVPGSLAAKENRYDSGGVPSKGFSSQLTGHNTGRKNNYPSAVLSI